ncbi:MAG: TolC family protein [Planctomycetes bacterium]|nr:TolC family protein [Planctomycetota bacterium]
MIRPPGVMHPVTATRRLRLPGLKSTALPLLALAILTSCTAPTPIETWQSLGRYHEPVEVPAAVETAAENAGGGEEAADPGPLSLTLKETILRTLENNQAFRTERLSPAIRRTYEEQERAAFDPTLSAAASAQHLRDDSNVGSETTDSDTGDIRLSGFLPSGTTVEIGGSGSAADSEGGTDIRSTDASWDITVSQSLLRDRGTGVNLARLRQARLDTKISTYELRGAAEALVAQTEEAYWDYVLAERSIEIFEQSLAISRQQVEEVKERIRVGKIAETELVAAEAETASRHEELIQARGAFAKRRLALVRLLNLSGGQSAWDRQITLTDAPEIPSVQLDSVQTHVAVAFKERPDLNQARLMIQRGDLEIVRTRNGLLPKLDVFVGMGGSRYANSFLSKSDVDGDDISYAVGIAFEVPFGNRDARARHERAMLSREQSLAALRNMEQLVQVDVRSAYVDAERAAERIRATRATRDLREKSLNVEEEKFRVGKSTTFVVSQARRDLVASRIAEVEAVIGYRKALLDLYRLEGSLLHRWGIDTP